jgi:hypothetical protein
MFLSSHINILNFSTDSSFSTIIIHVIITRDMKAGTVNQSGSPAVGTEAKSTLNDDNKNFIYTPTFKETKSRIHFININKAI